VIPQASGTSECFHLRFTFWCGAGDNLLMNPQFLWCTLDARGITFPYKCGDEHDLVKQLQAYAAIKSFGEMAHQPFGIVLEVRVQPKS
jgi:hypothetical protein